MIANKKEIVKLVDDVVDWGGAIVGLKSLRTPLIEELAGLSDSGCHVDGRIVVDVLRELIGKIKY